MTEEKWNSIKDLLIEWTDKYEHDIYNKEYHISFYKLNTDDLNKIINRLGQNSISYNIYHKFYLPDSHLDLKFEFLNFRKHCLDDLKSRIINNKVKKSDLYPNIFQKFWKWIKN